MQAPKHVGLSNNYLILQILYAIFDVLMILQYIFILIYSDILKLRFSFDDKLFSGLFIQLSGQYLESN